MIFSLTDNILDLRNDIAIKSMQLNGTNGTCLKLNYFLFSFSDKESIKYREQLFNNSDNHTGPSIKQVNFSEDSLPEPTHANPAAHSLATCAVFAW